MHNPKFKFLLVIVAIALVILPMRGALALPMIADADNMQYCAQMNMQTTDLLTVMQQQDAAAKNSYKCDQDCDGACSVCPHTAPTLSDSVFIKPELHHTPRNAMFLVSFPESTVIPPLRPPTFLHS